MLVEIPDPIVILGVVLPIFVGLFSLFAYLKIRQISGFNAQNKADMERLEFYERQIIDMKIRLDAIDIENISNTPEIPRNFASFEQKIHESVPTTAAREPKGKSREHISKTMKKLVEDGYVERNMRTKPYSDSITQKGRGRLGLDQNPAPEMAPQTA